MSDMNAYLAIPGGQTPHMSRLPVPTPAEHELLVRVHAAALNNGDLAPVDEQTVPGWEFVGEVVDGGNDVSAGVVGRRVMGISAGSFAEYVTAHHRHVVVVPDVIDDVSAATLPTGLMTEHGAVERSGLEPADSVLITAAASGIGLLGIQVARHAGARLVIGTTRNDARRALLERAGVDHVINTTTGDLAEATRAVTRGAGADVVLDHVGGDTLDAAVQAARVGGSVVSVGRLAGGIATLDLFALARRRVVLQSVSYGPTPPEVIGDLLEEVGTRLLPAVADGSIRPFVDCTFDFDQLGPALARLRTGEAEGKVVLAVMR